ncbi:bacteriocin family protein [Candidatus Obscuribacterales bacterium]|nr:bacteriocin family protein [Candidatus Obscuribacterales bacterium]MBX3137760.1 bacteriocin family protein [Candidatus Obscuribacterales bacterium]MBX3152271.1 bacteriocin family protein [Candidatus Obscuribacterales bacterium]
MWKSHQRLSELPLSPEQANAMLQAAVMEVRRTVVARKLMALFGPLGAGTETVSLETIKKDSPAEIDLEGKPDPSPIGAHEKETYVRVPLIYKDFILHWRDVKYSQDTRSPLDNANAVRAAHQVGDAEDALLFNGNAELGIHGLLNCPGSQSVQGGDWSKAGDPVRDVYAALKKLLDAEHHFPYVLLTSVDMYEQLLKPVKESPVLELEQLSKLCSDGVLWSPQVPPKTAALLSTGSQNFDIAVAEDLSIAYLGPSDMNYRFRVYESLVLRVKRPTAICVIHSK